MIEDQFTQKIEPESPLKTFYQDTLACLTEPGRFFRERYPQFTLTRALVFALILNWLASFLEWMTRMVRHETLLDGFVKIREQLESLPIWKTAIPHLLSDTETLSIVPSWVMELSSVALNPFKTLFGLCLSAVFLFVGGYFLIPKNEQTSELTTTARDPIDLASFLKLVAVASSAPKLVGAILGFLPLSLGALIGLVYVLCIEIYAISIRYQVSKLRAVAIMILPSTLLVFIGSCIIGVFIAILMALFGAAFH